MPQLLFLALSLANVACADPQAPQAEAPPTQAEVDADVDEGVAHVLDGGGLKWQATWSGDLSGSTGGSVFTVQKIMMNMSLAGGALKEDRTGAAPQSLSATLTEHDGSWMMSNLRLTLPDGTACGVKDSMPTATVTDSNKKTFAATLSGSLGCGEGKAQQVTVEIKLNANP